MDGSTQKLPSREKRTKYEPIVMCDDSVYDLTRCGLTQEEIASHFKVTRETLLKYHQEAYDQGKADQRLKPRTIVFKTLDALTEKFEQNMAEVGEFCLDEEGNEIRKQVDTKLGKLVLEYAEAANRYLPKQLEIAINKNPFSELSDEELAAKIAAATKTIK